MAANDSTQPYVKRRKRKIIAWIAFGVGAVGCAVFAIIAFLGQVSGNFSITLNQVDQVKLGMSTESGFTDPASETSYLRAVGLTSASAISADIMPEDSELDSNVGGPKNGPNYLVYTFFIKNTSTAKVSYNVSLNIDSYKNPKNQAVSLLAILRMRVYENLVNADSTLTHSMKTYGQAATAPFTKSDGTIEYRDPISLCTKYSDGTKVLPTTLEGNMKAENVGWCDPFESNTVAYDRIYTDLPSQDVVRYTVVVWLEGNDPDCIGDEPVGASVTFSMHFSPIQEIG
jgi:hypothetical protein